MSNTLALFKLISSRLECDIMLKIFSLIESFKGLVILDFTKAIDLPLNFPLIILINYITLEPISYLDSN